MTERPTAAGGFFLIDAIFVGFFLGARHGDPLGGSLIGTLVGTIIAIAVWQIDKRRARRR